MPHSPLSTEWTALQNQYDSYEKYSLVIKLAAVGVLALASLSERAAPVIVALLLVLWLQDAIWKTFQGRIEARLYQLEAGLAGGEAVGDHNAFQYNTLYKESRPGFTGLLAEYLKQALRPTVAYPHLVLVCLAAIQLC